MMWFLGMVAVAIIACGAFLASGKFGEMPDLVDDQPVPRLPEGDFTAQDIKNLRFARTVRGYAPHQVDEFLDRAVATFEGGLARPLTGADVRASAFDVVTRGYHMAQVDQVLDRLADQVDQGPVGAPTGARHLDAE